MTILFQDDFEGSLLGDWTAYDIGPLGAESHLSANGGSVTLTTDEKHSGSKSLQCSWAAGDWSVGIDLHQNLGKEIYFRWYTKWETGWDWPSSHKYWLMYSADNAQRMGFYTVNQTIWFWGEPWPSNYQTYMAVYDEAYAEHGTDYGSWTVWTPQTDTWYCIEVYLKVHPTEGTVRIWVDGVEKEIWSVGVSWGAWWYNDPANTPMQPINIDCGNADVTKLHMSTQNNDKVSTKDIWFDDIVISTEYVGLVTDPDVVSFSSDPAGTPSPVESGADVTCTATASDAIGHAITYAWTATGGTFDDATAQNPTWTAPANETGELATYNLTCTATCSESETAESTFQIIVNFAEQEDDTVSQERDAFLWVRAQLEAHANIASTDIFWGNPILEGTRTFAIVLEDGGRSENEGSRKISITGKFFTTVCKIVLLVRALPAGATAQTAELSGIVEENTGILDKWAEIEDAVGANAVDADAATVRESISSYQDHTMTPVTPIRLDEHPGWRGRTADVQIKLSE